MNGISISDNSLRLVCLAPKGSTYIVTHFQDMKMPEGVLEHGVVRDKEGLFDALRTLRLDSGIRDAKVSLYDPYALVITVEIPNVGEYSEHYIYEALSKEHPEIQLDAYAMDITPVFIGEDKARFNVSLVPETMVEEYINIFEEAGITPSAIELHHKAVSSALPREESPIAVLDVGPVYSYVYVVKNGVCLYRSQIPFGSAFDSYTDIKRCIHELIERLSFFEGAFEEGSVGALFLSGDIVRGGALYNTLVSQLPYTLRVPNPLEHVGYTSTDVPPIHHNHMPLFTSAIGVLLL